MMPPNVALLLFVAGIFWLFWLDRDEEGKTSVALWLPVIYLLIGSSRPISLWLGLTPTGRSEEAYLDGSPLDRAVFTSLLVLGVAVLISRANRVSAILRANWPILLFIGYCLLSVTWSDFAAVAFRRWIKSLSDLVMVLIVLTDQQPLTAVRRLFARTAFILVPLSILCIKYFPAYGRYYDRWEGTQYYSGVTTDKNMLGMVCLVMGVGSFWRFFHEYRKKKSQRKKGTLFAHLLILAMLFWLLQKANSMTSLSCCIFATCLIIATTMPNFLKKTYRLHLMVIAMLTFAYCILFLNMGSGILLAIGRNPTLTGRTDLWAEILKIDINPIFGTGFESFWLGDRLQKLWSIYWWQPNESHNGYLEMYINLGFAGIGLLGMVIANGYRNVFMMLKINPELGSLRLAFIVVALSYNFTEAAFKSVNPIWLALLLSVAVLDRHLHSQPIENKLSYPSTEESDTLAIEVT